MHNVINKPEYAETVKELQSPVRQAPQKTTRYRKRLPGATGKLAVKPQWDCAPSRLTPPFTRSSRNRLSDAIDDGGTGFKPHKNAW